jgi:hypothetical protein
VGGTEFGRKPGEIIMKSFALACVLVVASTAPAAEVLILSSGDPALDEAVLGAVEQGGHEGQIGPQFFELTGEFDLAPYDVVYLQCNFNWSGGDMPADGQESLLAFVDAGGGLVTGEWTVWKAVAAGQFQVLRPALPAAYGGFWARPTATFAQSTPDATLNQGLPDSFQFPLDSYGGSETLISPKCGATAYYDSTEPDAQSGVVGWNYGVGRVLSFSTLNGPAQVGDPNFATLLANAMAWASLAGGPGAYSPDCDGSGALDLFDFLCFTNAFNGGQPYADCTGDGVMDLFDFLCFVNTFNAGC